MSEDQIRFASGDTNHYRYVENNPVMYSDPSGNNPFAIGGGLAGGVIGGITAGSQSTASCFTGKVMDTLAGAATGFSGGFMLGFGIPTPGIIGGEAIAIGGAVSGAGPAAIGVFGDFGNSFCNPPPPSCEDKK